MRDDKLLRVLIVGNTIINEVKIKPPCICQDLEVICLAVLGDPLQVRVGVKQVLPALRDLRGDQRVKVSRHFKGACEIYMNLKCKNKYAPKKSTYIYYIYHRFPMFEFCFQCILCQWSQDTRKVKEYSMNVDFFSM